MAKCAACSVDTGNSGVAQANGKTLCAACDVRARAASGGQRPVDALNITFCPKCSSVWNRTKTYCEKCHWDVVAQQHVEVKPEEKRGRLQFDLVGVVMAVVVVSVGYFGYAYYRDMKRKEHEEKLALQEREIEAERNNAAMQRKAEEEALEIQKRNQIAMEKARIENEAERLKQIEAKAKQEAEFRARQDEIRKQREADIAERMKKSQEANEARKRELEKLKAAANLTKEQKIAQMTDDLKASEESLKKARQTLETSQGQLAPFKNRVESADRQCVELRSSMAKLVAESQKAAVVTRTVRDRKDNLKEITETRAVTMRGEFTELQDNPVEAQFPVPSNNYEEQAMKLKQRFNSVRKERNDSADKLTALQRQVDIAREEINLSDVRIADLKKTLAQMGAGAAPPAAKTTPAKPSTTGPSTSSVAPSAPAPGAPKAKEVKVYTLKDGAVIRAVTAIESEGEITLKDELGKFRTIAKDDVVKVDTEKAQ